MHSYQRIKQKGSLMIEMVAVIGLISLITPILFHQINTRNEEIINTQIATEMRMLKDAASSFIQANEDWLAKYSYADNGCNLWDNTNKQYKDVSNASPNQCGGTNAVYSIDVFEDFLVSPDGVLDDYDVYFFGYTVPTNCYYDEGTDKDICEYRPVIYAAIVQTQGMGTLRRASKIASLIGLEGGVATSSGSLNGMQGVWNLPISGLTSTAVGVISSFDDAANSTILKDVRWQHMQSDTAQADTMASKRMGIKEVLTVDTSSNCIANYGNGTVQIKAKNETGSTCTPFFEVNPKTKEVTLTGVIAGESTGASCNGLTGSTCENTNGCVWTEGKCLARYQIDPKYTSVMNDIKLTSRGGARLSDILPKWSLAGVETVPSGTTILRAWTCPANHNYAITVIPTKFTSAATSASTFEVSSSTHNTSMQTSVTVSSNVASAVVQKYCVWVDSQSVKGASDPTTPVKTRPATAAE